MSGWSLRVTMIWATEVKSILIVMAMVMETVGTFEIWGQGICINSDVTVFDVFVSILDPFSCSSSGLILGACIYEVGTVILIGVFGLGWKSLAWQRGYIRGGFSGLGVNMGSGGS